MTVDKVIAKIIWLTFFGPPCIYTLWNVVSVPLPDIQGAAKKVHTQLCFVVKKTYVVLRKFLSNRLEFFSLNFAVIFSVHSDIKVPNIV